MLLAMPKAYQRTLPMQRYFLSNANEIAYRNTLADRGTALGDSALVNRDLLPALGIPLGIVAMMPETYAILTHPQNIIWGVQRDIKMRMEEDIRADGITIVVTLRCDFAYEEETAVVLAYGITASV